MADPDDQVFGARGDFAFDQDSAQLVPEGFGVPIVQEAGGKFRELGPPGGVGGMGREVRLVGDDERARWIKQRLEFLWQRRRRRGAVNDEQKKVGGARLFEGALHAGMFQGGAARA